MCLPFQTLIEVSPFGRFNPGLSGLRGGDLAVDSLSESP